MAEDLILQTVETLWRRRATYDIRRGITASHLIAYGVPYSKSRMYDFLRLLVQQGRLQKVGQRGGYVPFVEQIQHRT